MDPLLVAILSFSTFIAFSNGVQFSKLNHIGINYGRQGDNLPSPYRSIEYIKSMKAGIVKLYDADPETLKLLAGTGLRVSIMVQNGEIFNIASNESIAKKWVRDNVLAYYPRTMIRYIMVGNEVYGNQTLTQWKALVLAMQHVKNCLRNHNIHNIKIGAPMAMNVMSLSFPPSNGTFHAESLSTVVPLLQFLNKTSSFFFLNVFPYFPWAKNPENISLNFALFKGGNLSYTDPGSGLVYTNLLDQMLDSVHFAMAKLGFRHISIAISETGWPNDGDLDQPGANIHNAATYNRNLIHKMATNPTLGTPARPGVIIPTFLFSLYNENLKNGPGTERHWGLLHPSGSPLYSIDLTGTRYHFEPLPKPQNNRAYEGQVWCVLARFANMSGLGPLLSDMCRQLDGTCETALGPGKACYEPVSLTWHASYAFSAYWAKYRDSGDPCYFNGLASLTTIDPSKCRF
ncbi:hypothetical protein Cgig2_028639 [Carnegiea gigantea]|uniref:glucan endo-1,3-beta-D-glucosidase n=1 Tax=Carnegiea gigantea TaxID=171969 RepID=A0A9Q1JXJ4_9CARY|nr:hypothetical protein Cgig2_028639 [Carnegiea gigantea]